MLEIKRIFCTKRHVSVCIVLLLLCVILEQIQWKDQNSSLDSYFLQKEAYVEEYDHFYEKISQDAQSMKQINLFSNENSFSYRNIEKTVKDYSAIRDIHIQVVDTRAEEAFLNTGTAELILFAYVLFLVTNFMDERKKGIWPLQHSTKMGDSGLFFWRFLALVGGSTLFTIVLGFLRKCSVELFYHRPMQMGIFIQNIEIYRNIYFRFNIYQYIAYYLLIRIITLIFIGLFLWLVFSLQRSNIIAYLMGTVFLAGEYLCYSLISENSVFVFFRFCNIFSVIYPKEILDRYLNLNVWNHPVHIQTVFFLCVGGLGTAMLLLLLLIRKKQRPNAEYHRVTAFINENWKGRVSVFSHLGTVSVEWYKLIFPQKGFAVLILMIYFLVSFLGVPNHHRSFTDAYCQKLYDQYGGTVTEETLQSLRALNRDPSIENEAYKNAIEQILGEAQRIYRLNKGERGNYALVSPYAYKSLFSKENDSFFQLQNIKIFLILILLLSGLFAYEKEKHTEPMIFSTREGKGSLFFNKQISGWCLLFVVSGLFFAQELSSAGSISGGFSSPFAFISSISELSAWNGRFTFFEALLFLYLNRFLGLMLVFQIVNFLSILVKKTVYVKVISLVLFVFPMLFDYFEFGFAQKVSLNRWLVPGTILSWHGGSVFILIVINSILLFVTYRVFRKYPI